MIKYLRLRLVACNCRSSSVRKPVRIAASTLLKWSRFFFVSLLVKNRNFKFLEESNQAGFYSLRNSGELRSLFEASSVFNEDIAGICEQVLRIENISDVTLIPMLEGDSPDSQRGGCMKDGAEVPLSLQIRSRKGQLFTSRPLAEWLLPNRQEAHVIDGTWLYGGFFYEHFGHFISESVPRLWPLLLISNKLSIDGICFLGSDAMHPCDASVVLPPTHSEIVSYFLGNTTCDIRVLRSPALVSNLMVSTQASALGPLSQPSDRYIDMLTVHQSSILSSTFLNAKIYVSRSRLKTTSRLIGEQFLEQILASAGYLVFHPQEYSIAQQLSVYAASKTIVCCEGSAIHGIELLGRIKANCFVISRGGLRSHRIKSMLSILSKRSSSVSVFHKVNRHPPFEIARNALGMPVAAHWKSGVWLSYKALIELLCMLDVAEDLQPSIEQYSGSLKAEALDYLWDFASDGLMLADEGGARACRVFLDKLMKSI